MTAASTVIVRRVAALDAAALARIMGDPAVLETFMRRARLPAILSCCVALAALALGAHAQPGPPGFVAPPGSLRVEPDEGPRIDALQLAQEAVELYRQTCAASGRRRDALADLALAAGLQPYRGEGGTSSQTLLGGASGQVYVPPHRAHHLQLALGDDGRCTVWVQQAEGPGVKAGFLTVMEALRAEGAVVRPTHDRVIERAGGWRQQTGFEVRDAGGTRSFDAVTLLIERPGLQMLSTGPATAAAR